ncbi:putative multidrug resistance protein EmrK [mine drainage metagenome]|uniref:Putative multidrug resistance protein EmrK n=1 Tax=mine drainage metagenome TaxID=410659 RepID=A0A1J5RXB8_9ZZZZ
MTKRKALIFVGTALGLALAVSGYEWLTNWRFHEDTDDAYLRSDITSISPKVGGHVADLAVTDNQHVRKGQLLLRIDDRDYRARVAEMQALVAAREAALANLEARIALQQSNVSAAEARVGSASAEVVRSRADLARSRALVRDQFVSRQMLDTHQADSLKATSAMRAAEATAQASRREFAVLDSEHAMDLAQLDQARAQLEAARLDLAHTVVTAPVDGVVGNRGVEVGEYVRPGTPLLSVVPLTHVWVEANFKETQIAHMRPGQPVGVSIDAFPGQEIAGRVDSLSPASGADFSLLPPDNATGNFTKVVQRIPVKILLDPGRALAGKLRPGMSAVVTVDTHGRAVASAGDAPKLADGAP